MRAIAFKAKCPYEIGDKLCFDKCGDCRVMEVTDIITVMSAKTGGVKFVLELDNGARYIPLRPE